MFKKMVFLSIFFLAILMGSVAIAASLSDLEKLGEAVYNNKNLSLFQNQSCKTCHHQKAAFADPVNQASPTEFPVSEGSIADSYGNRNAPSAAYAGFSPIFHWNGDEGLFIGGVFWDGRASGRDVTATAAALAMSPDPLAETDPTRDPMADQAKGPFLNPIEMALEKLSDVVDTVLKDPKLFKIFANYFPEALNPDGSVKDYPAAYNGIAEAIAAFERSSVLNRFSSRFDQFAKEYGGDVSTFGVKEITINGTVFRAYEGPPPGFTSKYLTQKQLIGLALFNSDSVTQLELESQLGEALPLDTKNGGMCYLCHLTTPYNTADYDTADGNLSLVAAGSYPPLFTDFSYDNLGIPENYRAVELFEKSGNNTYSTDFGLGSQTAILQDANPGYTGNENGKFKVPSLRGVAKSAPYGHNGFFPTLLAIVEFYNDRDGFYNLKDLEPEVGDTVNVSELGNLGMNAQDMDAIVAFMQTLTDQ